MRVILDTTAIVADPRLSSIAWRSILGASAASRVQVYVPEVCILEAVAHFGRRMEDKQTAISKLASELRGLADIDDSLAEAGRSLATAMNEYEKFLRKRLRDERVKIVAIPRTSHRELVLRSTSRRKPNDHKGDGYRDTLNWMLIKSLATAGQDEITWVSSNTSDFGDGSGALHPDLAAELSGPGFAPVRYALQPKDVDLPRPVESEALAASDSELSANVSAYVSEYFGAEAFLLRQRPKPEDLALALNTGRVRLTSTTRLDPPVVTIRSSEATGFVAADFAVTGLFSLSYTAPVADDDGVRESRTAEAELEVVGTVALEPEKHPAVEVESITVVAGESDGARPNSPQGEAVRIPLDLSAISGVDISRTIRLSYVKPDFGALTGLSAQLESLRHSQSTQVAEIVRNLGGLSSAAQVQLKVPVFPKGYFDSLFSGLSTRTAPTPKVTDVIPHGDERPNHSVDEEPSEN